jgi:hypothetical protein
MSTSVTLYHARDTKGTHFFATTNPEEKVTSLYVKKGTFKDNKAPASITVTIEASTEG